MDERTLVERLRQAAESKNGSGPWRTLLREAADTIDYAIRAADVNDRALDELTTERDQSRMSVAAMDRIYDEMKAERVAALYAAHLNNGRAILAEQALADSEARLAASRQEWETLRTLALRSFGPVGHPEDFCDDCGRRNVSWWVDSPMWNKLVREPVGHDPMLCPTCFVLRAEAQGVRATWEIRPDPLTLKGWEP